MNQTYSNLLHASARKWGVPVVADCPLIDDDTTPYPVLVIVEKLAYQGKRIAEWAEIELVTLNGRWSFAATFSTWNSGGGFGPFLKFCDPVETREDALDAAVAWLRHEGADKCDDLRKWLHKLGSPQLTLFAMEDSCELQA